MTENARQPSHFSWPFFDAQHLTLAKKLDSWAASLSLPGLDEAHPTQSTVDETCRKIVQALGCADFLRLCIDLSGSPQSRLDCRAICIARETLARHHALLDFAFGMQGLGSGAISLAGTQEQRSKYLNGVVAGRCIAAFALSEPHSGSDVGAMQCTVQRDGNHFILNGEKTWISNGGIADFYVVFARSPQTHRSKGISAFIVDADSAGLEVAERLEVMSPHPLARLRFSNCRVPVTQLLGVEGDGFKLAMQTLDIFRTSVAAAALGFARCALSEAVQRANEREMFGTTLGAMQITQAKVATMACAVDAAALLVYRAAWMKDQGIRITKEAAMAKLVATESAQMVIDAAVQICGGEGVKVGSKTERLYRDIRALRIYEGATEVQQIIIGSDVLKAAAHAASDAKVGTP